MEAKFSVGDVIRFKILFDSTNTLGVPYKSLSGERAIITEILYESTDSHGWVYRFEMLTGQVTGLKYGLPECIVSYKEFSSSTSEDKKVTPKNITEKIKKQEDIKLIKRKVLKINQNF